MNLPGRPIPSPYGCFGGKESNMKFGLRRFPSLTRSTAAVLAFGALTAATIPAASLILSNTNQPPRSLRLVFIHHSTGQAWLADDHGGLGLALRDNGYFVSDSNYGWGPDSIGDNTDIGH